MLCIELGWTEAQLRNENTIDFLNAINWVYSQQAKKNRFKK
jgi:hypothetical protein